MEPLHAPIVRINGQTVPTGWELAEASLLDELTIDWGQATVYEEVPPAFLRLELLWPSGGIITIDQLQDAPIEVEVPSLGRVLFRGRITRTKWSETYVWEEHHQANRAYWIVKVAAHDIAGQIAATIPTPRDAAASSATSSGGVLNTVQKTLSMWPFFGAPSDYPDGREVTSRAMPISVRDELVAADITAPFEIASAARPTYVNGGVRTFMQKIDAWQLLREAWGTHPLGEPSINQDARTVELQRPTTIAAGIRLIYTGGKLQLQTASAGNPSTGAAGAVRLTGDDLTLVRDRLEVSTDQLLNIGRVDYEVNVSTDSDVVRVGDDGAGNPLLAGVGMLMSTTKASIDVPTAGGVARTYSRRLYMSLYAMRYFGNVLEPVDANDGGTIQGQLQATRTLIAKLNGKVPLPDCVIELEADRDRLPAWAWTLFLSIDPHRYINYPVIVTGAALVQQLSISLSGQVIGGQLSYRQGWRHELRFAPVQNELAGDLTIGQLVTNTTATYGDYADDVTFGDLALITQGAS